MRCDLLISSSLDSNTPYRDVNDNVSNDAPRTGNGGDVEPMTRWQVGGTVARTVEEYKRRRSRSELPVNGRTRSRLTIEENHEEI